MRLVLLGMPGCGKGTQAKMISEEFGWLHISTGKIFRDLYSKKDPLGVKVHDNYWSKGILVPDKETSELVEKALKGKKDFILDGYPRNINQFKTLEKMTAIDAMLGFECETEVLKERLLNRARTENRADDAPEKVKVRFDQYEKETFPLWNYLSNSSEPVTIERTYEIRVMENGSHFIIIDGNRTAEDIFDDIRISLDSLRR